MTTIHVPHSAIENIPYAASTRRRSGCRATRSSSRVRLVPPGLLTCVLPRLARSAVAVLLSRAMTGSPWPTPKRASDQGFRGADDGIRTRDPHLGKVMLYQLSHVRVGATG